MTSTVVVGVHLFFSGKSSSVDSESNAEPLDGTLGSEKGGPLYTPGCSRGRGIG